MLYRLTSLEMDMMTQVQIMDQAVSVSRSSNTIVKSFGSNYSPSNYE